MTLLEEFEELCKYIREVTGGDLVCGLCEYDAGTVGEEPMECPGFNSNECFKLKESFKQMFPGYNGHEVILCKDCKYNNGGRCGWHGGAGYKWIVDDDDFCSVAERKDEYVTLHHEDIHFNSEEDEKAFYEALAEMKNTRSFTAEEWEFYKKVNREKMQKTGLNIRDFMGEERKEE